MSHEYAQQRTSVLVQAGVDGYGPMWVCIQKHDTQLHMSMRVGCSALKPHAVGLIVTTMPIVALPRCMSFQIDTVCLDPSLFGLNFCKHEQA